MLSPIRWFALLTALLLSACGGGGDVDADASGLPQAPTPVDLTGIWGAPYLERLTMLFVSPTGKAYGLLVDPGAGMAVVRGDLLGHSGSLPTTALEAVNLGASGTRWSFALQGTYTPKDRLNLRFVPDTGASISAGYNPIHDDPVALPDLAGDYTDTLSATPGRTGAVRMTIAAEGGLQLAEQSASAAHCQASGRLSRLLPTHNLMAFEVSFNAAGCLLDSGTTIKGLAMFDRSTGILLMLGMNEPGTVALAFHASRR